MTTNMNESPSMSDQAALLKEASATIKEQSEILDRLSKAAMGVAVVVGKNNDNYFIRTGGGIVAVEKAPPIDIGDPVLLHPQTGQIVKKTSSVKLGTTQEVLAVHEHYLEISLRGERVTVARAKSIKAVEVGDDVLVDQTGCVALEKLESKRKEYIVTPEPTHWVDIGGNEEAKQALIEAIELPHKHPKLFASYNAPLTNGILLWGPPGTGKTMLGKAVATSLGSDGGFIAIKGPEVLDPYVGVAEATIRSVFSTARQYMAKTKKRPVVFIDEADSLLGKRGRGFGMEKTIVPAFLTEMQGLEAGGPITILCTNRADTLDPAVVRDGRIDCKIEVKRPSMSDAAQIFYIYLSKLPVSGNAMELAEFAASETYKRPLPYSGALCEGIVKKAARVAIGRDMARGKPSGVCHEDLAHAVSTTSNQSNLENAL